MAGLDRIRVLRREREAGLETHQFLDVGLNPLREKLVERIHSRTDAMLDGGWLQEVKSLLASGTSEEAKPFDFIGYRELREVLKKKISLAEAREAIQQATRRYAKRQLTWFRREQGVRWFSGFGDEPTVQAESMNWLRSADLS